MTNDISRRGFLGAAGVAAAAGAVHGAVAAQGAEAGTAGKTIKIIAVACSARAGKNTAAALQACLEAAKAVDPEGIEVELIELAGKRMNGLVAAGVELQPGEKDDFPEIAPKLCDPAVGGIIIGTPVYFSSMSSLCKEFLERCGDFRKQDYALANKVGGALAVGGTRGGGQEITVRSVEAVLFAQDMIIVGPGKPNSRFGATLCSGGGGVTEDDHGLGVARSLGQRVAEVARLLRAAKGVS
jgi:multimeric flavodoxin WrbA